MYMDRDGGMWVCTWRIGMEVCGYVHGEYLGEYGQRYYMEKTGGRIMWVSYRHHRRRKMF